MRWARSWVIQKFIYITAFLNPGVLKLVEWITRGVQQKSCSWKFYKIDRKGPVFQSDTGFLLSILRNFWEHFFYRTFPGDCFWWRRLRLKNFNFVSLIFLNSQLYHATPEWWLLFRCNKEHFLIKKTWLNFK